MNEKERLDLVMVEQKIVETREKARSLIMAGQIMVNDKKIDKAGTKVSLNSNIRIIGETIPFVSRGGLKLQKALNYFAINLHDKTVLDIGASTGGFTDCALQEGARKVYAVDVGHGQLDWKIRSDNRVISLEKTNARYLTAESLSEKVDFITYDVAFISLEKVISAAIELQG